jgi:hypothetical protein
MVDPLLAEKANGEIKHIIIRSDFFYIIYIPWRVDYHRWTVASISAEGQYDDGSTYLFAL